MLLIYNDESFTPDYPVLSLIEPIVIFLITLEVHHSIQSTVLWMK